MSERDELIERFEVLAELDAAVSLLLSQGEGWPDEWARKRARDASLPPPEQPSGLSKEGLLRYIEQKREYLLRVVSHTPNAELSAAAIGVLAAMAEEYVRGLTSPADASTEVMG
jgi:hypothetical protein